MLAIQHNVNDKLIPGTLRNLSSAGESARSFMRSTNGMVDTLLWLLKAGVQQKSAADEKVSILMHIRMLCTQRVFNGPS